MARIQRITPVDVPVHGIQGGSLLDEIRTNSNNGMAVVTVSKRDRASNRQPPKFKEEGTTNWVAEVKGAT